MGSCSDTQIPFREATGTDLNITLMNTSKTILIVDDDSNVHKVLSHLLKDYSLTIKNNVVEAVLYLEQHQVDIVLLDVMMPGMSGYDFIHIVRERQPSLPVYIVSEIEDQPIIENFFKLGISGFYRKSRDLAKLKADIYALS